MFRSRKFGSYLLGSILHQRHNVRLTYGHPYSTKSDGSDGPSDPPLPSPGLHKQEKVIASEPKLQESAPADKTTPQGEAQSFEEPIQSGGENGFLARCAEGRRKINALWGEVLAKESERQATLMSQEEDLGQSFHAVFQLIAYLELDPGRPIAQDITRGVGEAIDRLLILTVKGTAWYLHRRSIIGKRNLDWETPAEDINAALPNVLKCIARNGVTLELKTVQHMFASCYNYTQALSIFEEIKLCGMVMDASVYYTMVFCLQRLDEESWGRTFYQERQSMQRTSDSAMKFVLHGPDNQLLPESKPHLGRVMYADVPQVFPYGKAHDYDATGKDWNQRYQS
ncbi:hypothetical protein XU18_0226 [Perkinsela sp. CCAP 1560/4]|nr:hypothetical protein XU18_0226 [Perkinsela sp. CCAP 1560/4]|eukprot:KNH09541.1 hypothetical protein XU18_0226 [Perkinsela sp. CCAP 1560/4]